MQLLVHAFFSSSQTTKATLFQPVVFSFIATLS